MNLINEKEIFGHNIQILINQRNWSIQHAAKEIKYDRNKLSKILIGQQNFKLTTAIKFARFSTYLYSYYSIEFLKIVNTVIIFPS